MTANVGTLDRALRADLGLGLFHPAFLSGVPAFASSFLKYAVAAVGVVMLVAAAVRTCPVFAFFGLKTCRT